MCSAWHGMWGIEDAGGHTSSSNAFLEAGAWPVHPGKKLHLCRCLHPSTVGHPLGAHSNSTQCSSQHPMHLMKASTSGKTLGMKPSPSDLQHLPSAASPMCWSARVLASSHCCPLHPCPVVSSSRNCPMFMTVGAGGQMGDVETIIAHLHMAISCQARANMATSLSSVKG